MKTQELTRNDKINTFVNKERDIRVYYKVNYKNEIQWFNFHFGQDDIDDCFFDEDRLLMDMYVKYTRNIENPLLNTGSIKLEWMLDVIDIYIQLLNN